MSRIDQTGAYFHKTVGVLGRNTVDEEERAVAYLSRNAHGPDDLRALLDHLGLGEAAQRMTRRRSA